MAPIPHSPSAELVEKDFHWDAAGVAAATSVAFFTTKAMTGYWKANDCSFVWNTGRGCWLVSLGGALISTIAAATAGGLGGGIAFKGATGDELRKVSHYTTLDKIATLMSEHGHTLLGATGFHGQLSERDSYDDGFNNSITWSTGNKTRVSMFRAGTSLSLLTDAFESGEHGTLEATLLGGGVPKANFTKRDQSFDVNWFSLEYDNINHDLDEKVYTQEPRELEDWDYDNSQPYWFAHNPAWKYCFAVVSNPNPGNSIDFSRPQNAFHGEIYFNTWGGVDNQCNDNNDGYYIANY